MNKHQFFEKYKQDFSAGLVVFLVALPLCLGIALASNAPLMSGVISGAIAGLIVSWLSGSSLSVSGPAAGLTVLVASGIQELQTFEAFCAATVITGVFQLLFSFLGFGFIAGVFPNSVIKGMLAAIGLIIILKQIPHGLGYDADYEGDLGFWELAGENTITDIIRAVFSASAGPILICLASLVIITLWSSNKIRKPAFLNLIPGALVAVVASILLNELFKKYIPALGIIDSSHLVSLPVFETAAQFFGQFKHPDWSAFLNVKVYGVALVIAIIASVETLLCIEATDKIDPLRRLSSMNRELFAQGVGNTIAGMVGGIPMTSVIVRSSANVYAGARTRMSSFVHGVLIFLSVLFFPKILNMVPLATLAAVLFVVGYKLAPISLFKQMFHKGFDQFFPFLVTVVAILFSDLLKGVCLGLLVGTILALWGNFYSAITVVRDGRYFLIKFTKDVTFINKLKLKSVLLNVPSNTKLLIDGSLAHYIDADIMEMIIEYQETAKHQNIEVEVKNLERKEFPKSFFKRKAKA